MKLFINYDYEDRDYVNKLINNMEEAGYDVSYFASALQVTDDWDAVILQHVQDCNVFIYLVGPESLQSPFCKDLYQYASALNKVILSVLIKPNFDLAFDWTTLSEDQVNLATLDLSEFANANKGLFLIVAALNKISIPKSDENNTTLKPEITKPDLKSHDPVIRKVQSVSHEPTQPERFTQAPQQSRSFQLLIGLSCILAIVIGILLVINQQSRGAEEAAQATLTAFITPVPFADFNMFGLVLPTPQAEGNICNYFKDSNKISITNIINPPQIDVSCFVFVDSQTVTDYEATLSINLHENSSLPKEYSINQAIVISQENKGFYCGLVANENNDPNITSGISAAFWGATTTDQGDYNQDFYNAVVSHEQETIPEFAYNGPYRFTLSIDDLGNVSCKIGSFTIPPMPDNPNFLVRVNLVGNTDLGISTYREGIEATTNATNLRHRP
jgi:hypothetical protein